MPRAQPGSAEIHRACLKPLGSKSKGEETHQENGDTNATCPRGKGGCMYQPNTICLGSWNTHTSGLKLNQQVYIFKIFFFSH